MTKIFLLPYTNQTYFSYKNRVSGVDEALLKQMNALRMLGHKVETYIPFTDIQHKYEGVNFYAEDITDAKATEKIYSKKIENSVNFHKSVFKRQSNKQLHMQYENILPYVGSYLTYEEFTKNCPEIDISKNEWYRLNKGQTYQKTKSELKRTYNDQFQKHWDKQRNIAFQLLKNVKE